MEKSTISPITAGILPDRPYDLNEEINGRSATIAKKLDEIASIDNKARSEYNIQKAADIATEKTKSEDDKRQEALIKSIQPQTSLEAAKALSKQLFADEQKNVIAGELQPALSNQDKIALVKATAQSTTPKDMQKLFNSLNINLNVQLSKKDTRDLLACILTCNETQLQALQNNKKVPVAIKTIIKKMLDNMETGNTAIIEKLWDRIFGKSLEETTTIPVPGASNVENSIIPGQPISREAYIILRDTIIK